MAEGKAVWMSPIGLSTLSKWDSRGLFQGQTGDERQIYEKGGIR